MSWVTNEAGFCSPVKVVGKRIDLSVRKPFWLVHLVRYVIDDQRLALCVVHNWTVFTNRTFLILNVNDTWCFRSPETKMKPFSMLLKARGAISAWCRPTWASTEILTISFP
jgi:hypothetical protein